MLCVILEEADKRAAWIDGVPPDIPELFKLLGLQPKHAKKLIESGVGVRDLPYLKEQDLLVCRTL